MSQQYTHQSVLSIMGPTASGKTALAMAIAQRLPCHVISVDSAMVYRGLDIVSAKPSTAELARVPHALIDLCDVTDRYNVARFVADAQREIGWAFEHGKLPVLVGGSMLYFHALQTGLSEMPEADPDLRATLTALALRSGGDALKSRLSKLDPDAAKRLHVNDHVRLIRAIEICEATQRPLSNVHSPVQLKADYHWRNVMLSLDRKILHTRLETRLKQMFAQGVVDEIAQFYRNPNLSRDLPAMRMVGVRQIWDYLTGAYRLEQCFESVLAANRQLAKHQLTWLRRWTDIHTIDAQSDGIAQEVIKLIRT